jgi:hypothetical protein
VLSTFRYYWLKILAIIFVVENFCFYITVALFANLEAKRAETDSKNLKTGILYKYDFEYS